MHIGFSGERQGHQQKKKRLRYFRESGSFLFRPPVVCRRYISSPCVHHGHPSHQCPAECPHQPHHSPCLPVFLPPQHTSSRGALQRLAVAADTHTYAQWPPHLRLEVRMVGWSTQTSCRCRLELTGCCSGRTFTQTCGLMINSKLLINRYSFPSPTLPPLPLPVDPAPPLPAPPPLPSLLQPVLASAASWSQLGPCTSWSGRRSGSCRWW